MQRFNVSEMFKSPDSTDEWHDIEDPNKYSAKVNLENDPLVYRIMRRMRQF